MSVCIKLWVTFICKNARIGVFTFGSSLFLFAVSSIEVLLLIINLHICYLVIFIFVSAL